ncbi:MAG TPA: cation:proton antiporter [Bacteroidota bacterium]|nr:cation:proton antiporter [Bacteroidota bacterium]
MHSALLYAIGLSIVAASVLSYFAQFLRQPPIIGYIAAGILIGPAGLRLIEKQEDIFALSELGLAFLLFIVGLEIDVKKFARSGTVSAVIGVIQVVLCSVIGFFLATWLGFEGLTAAYIGVALSFSSTMIVVKLLSDQGELDTLPGRISLGILLVQDVLAIFVLAAQSNINSPSWGPIALSIVMGLGLIAISFLASKYVLPAVYKRIAQNPELVLILSIAWCFVMCWLALKANFSIAMGALIAGVSISTFPYSHDVIVKLRSLRDFFVTLFFVSLGMQILFDSSDTFVAGGILSLFIMLSRFLTIFPVAYALNLGSRVGILSSVALAQSSEFSLVIATLGIGYGHISAEIVSIIATTLVVTSTFSTYLIMRGHSLARIGMALLESFGLKSSHHQREESDISKENEILILGCYRIGSSLVHSLSGRHDELRVLDFNPTALTKLKARGIAASYVDVSHFDALEEAGLERASIIVSTISDDFLRGTTNFKLLQFLKSRNLKAKIIVHASSVADALAMYEAGADYVLLPHVLSAHHLAEVIAAASNGTLEAIRLKEEEALRQRDDLLS